MPEHDAPMPEGELYEAGRAARARVPRSAQAEYAPPEGRDPMGILRTQHENRLPFLVGLRVERMSADPFAFYRGSAAIQAADLADAPVSGAHLVICGDAHLSNFGIYRSPEKAMVFDINDFDESAVGPWEWDLKRLLTSVVLAGRSLRMTKQDTQAVVLDAATMYRNGLRAALTLPLLDRYFTPTLLARRQTLSRDSERMIRRTMKASEKRTSERVASRTLEQGGDGSLRFVDHPPILTHLEAEAHARIDRVYREYRETLPANVSVLTSQYDVVDIARRVVGVGSVGTRCFVVALRGPLGEILILQLKEANTSVIEQFGRVAQHHDYFDKKLLKQQHGYRVVASQRILQAVSDPFLGYLTVEDHSFYMRIFRNRNASFVIADMNRVQFSEYAQSCAVVLARAHARSPKAAFAAGYVGNGDAFVRAATAWAHAYADQAEADFATFTEAARRGEFA